jgi:DNA-binding response OmpR family regulator
MNRPTLLCVEDDSTLPDAFGALLGSSGYRVLLAKDGGQAKIAFRNSRIDAVFVDDHQKTGASGSQIAAEIKQQSPATPVILVSSLQNVLEEGRNYVDATVPKGAELSQVLAQVKALVNSDTAA